MNYYNTFAINFAANPEDNVYPPTLLPFTAYNDYQDEFIQTFSSTVEIKHKLDSIVFSSIDINEYSTNNSSRVSAIESENEILTPLTSTNASDDETNQPTTINEAPLPLLSDDETSNQNNPNQEFQTALDKLKEVANLRDDIEAFIQYLSDKYNIDPNEELDDLPWEVIDEIMAYINYDPDKDDNINFDILSSSSSSDDTIIIPEEQIDSFRDLIHSLDDSVKRLSILYRINGITDKRIDDGYHRFQSIFKPTVEPLIRLYKHNIRDYKNILDDSINYYIEQSSNECE